MNVRLAVLLFSRSTAIGLHVYREEGTDVFQDTAETNAFTRMINDVFDALNAKLPKEGIRANSPKIQVIKDFLVMLDTTEFTHNTKNTLLFASRQTTESLRLYGRPVFHMFSQQS
ncbi:uncharacterized protein LOC144163958 [Haemaphysalis longicornis]